MTYTNESKGGLTVLLSEIRCTAPGKNKVFGHNVCARSGSQPKITQRMTGGQEPEGGWSRQPMHLCKEHWDKYPEINALDGSVKPKRKFPG